MSLSNSIARWVTTETSTSAAYASRTSWKWRSAASSVRKTSRTAPGFALAYLSASVTA